MKFLLSFFISLILLSTPLLAAPVRVAGVVVDETRHRPAANAGVELLRAREGQSTPVAKTRADGQGRFAFAPQNVGNDELLIVRTNWNNYTYVAPAYDGGGHLAEMNVKIDPAKVRLAVYETTTELVPLSFTAHHLAIESKAGGLKCVERIVVENPSRKTFLGLGERRATILVNLPAGAKNVELDPQVTDARLEKRPDGYAIIKPIPPSIYDPRVLVIINYDMDWPSGLPWERRLDFSRKVQYPTKFFFVARTSQDEKLEVVAPKLSPPQSAPLAIEGQMETRIVNAIGNPGHGGPQGGGAAKPALLPGDDLKIAVAAPVNPLFWGFLGFVALLCLAVPLALWKRNAQGESSLVKIAEPSQGASVYPRTFAPVDGLLQGEFRASIERLAHLDEDFASGKIAESEYSRQRAMWKNELVEQLLQGPEWGPSSVEQQAPSQPSEHRQTR